MSNAQIKKVRSSEIELKDKLVLSLKELANG